MKQKLEGGLCWSALYWACAYKPPGSAARQEGRTNHQQQVDQKGAGRRWFSLPAAKSAGVGENWSVSRPGKALAGNAAKAPTRMGCRCRWRLSAKAVRQVMMDGWDPRRLACILPPRSGRRPEQWLVPGREAAGMLWR